MTLAHFGLYGLGTMGTALAQNIAEHGFDLHVASYQATDTRKFLEETPEFSGGFTGHDSLAEMIRDMPAPRAVIFLIPAGQAVEDAISQAEPFLQPGDVLIDAGNSDFHDTRRRAERLEAKGLAYMGMGVSGGEFGARTGPSMMVGGTAAVWDALRPMLEAIAADYQGAPCVAHVGPDGAGHFVKTVHNGIEYADMQVLAETYGVMRHGLRMSPSEVGDIFARWNQGPLQSYLVEISAEVLRTVDPKTQAPLVDVIVDTAGQKGTGRWTAIEAQKLGISANTIEAAVGARVWSAARGARGVGAALFDPQPEPVSLSPETLEQAVLAARIIGHSQGFDLLAGASKEFGWNIDMSRCAEIWREGCIIRSALLNDIAEAFRHTPPEARLVFAPAMVARLKTALPALRQTVVAAMAAGHPVPVMSAALGWMDAMTQTRGTADLIQGQRDFFGRHGFERVDGGDGHHGPWETST